MSIQFVLLPLFVEVALTLACCSGCVGCAATIWSAVRYIRSKDRPARAELAAAHPQVANSFNNQFELPVLFYVLTILAIITRHADFVFVVLAWIFVDRRVSAMPMSHTTSNRVMRRGQLRSASALLVLIVMWIIFAVRILLAPAMTPAARLAAAIEVFGDSRASGARRPTRSRAGGWRIASPARATARPSPASSTTRCAGARRAPS